MSEETVTSQDHAAEDPQESSSIPPPETSASQSKFDTPGGIPPHLWRACFVTNVDEANESLHAWLDKYFLNERNNLTHREQMAHLLVDLITGKVPPSAPS